MAGITGPSDQGNSLIEAEASISPRNPAWPCRLGNTKLAREVAGD
jgi:hypothetical protein